MNTRFDISKSKNICINMALRILDIFHSYKLKSKESITII